MSREGAEGYLQATHPARGKNLPHVDTLGRRRVLKLLGGLAAAVATGAAAREIFKDHSTFEQKIALEGLNASGENDPDVLKNLVAVGEAENGKVLPVNLRNRPRTMKGRDMDEGEIIGQLAPGAIVEKARVVKGNDRRAPFVSEEKPMWVTFEYKGRAVFAYGSLFEDPSGKMSTVKPLPLK